MSLSPEAALAQLADCATPYLIGVRHHSPACAAAVPALLDALRPDMLLIELPEELAPWLAWVGHPEAEAPLALAGGRPGHEGLVFFPLADFSPELAALRWARAREVPVVPIDLPVGVRPEPVDGPARSTEPGLLDRLAEQEEADGVGALWDRLVEARASGSTPEAIRRAALLAGWAMRVDAAAGGGVDPEDLAREQHMRGHLAEHAACERPCALVGAFHASALLPEPLLFDAAEVPNVVEREGEVVTSLIPYTFELLDARSGYPAGIRDPRWRQHVLEAQVAGRSTEELAADVVVSTCRRLRARGHVAGVPDGLEALRLARGLAAIRALPGPGRREVLEGLESALARGEVLGRGRALAAALEEVMVGRRRGRLASGTPRSGLGPSVESLLSALRLPGRDQLEPKRLRLDPLRSDLDRRRHVTLERLGVCAIPYASPEVSERGETLGRVWTAHFSPQVDAAIELAGTRGVTLAQAAAGALRGRERRLEAEESLVAAERLGLLEAAADCGLPDEARRQLEALEGPFVDEAGLAELVAAHALVERIDRGHVPGLPRDPQVASAGPPGRGRPRDPPGAAAGRPGGLLPFTDDLHTQKRSLLEASVRACGGLFGSDRPEDSVALLELVRLFERQPEEALGAGRLVWTLQRLAAHGTPRMQGSAGATLVGLGELEGAAFGTRLASWVDGPCDPEALAALSARLQGALVVAGPLPGAAPPRRLPRAAPLAARRVRRAVPRRAGPAAGRDRRAGRRAGCGPAVARRSGAPRPLGRRGRCRPRCGERAGPRARSGASPGGARGAGAHRTARADGHPAAGPLAAATRTAAPAALGRSPAHGARAGGALRLGAR